MAATAPLMMRRRVLAAKVETTVGTAETLTASEAAFNVFDAGISPSIDTETRPGQGASFAKLPASPGARGGTCTFKVELAGSGSVVSPVPAWASTFLPGCGVYDDSDTFKLDSDPPQASGSNAKTLTIGLYEDGVIKKLRGAMGTFVITFTAGKRAMVEFTFTGIWCEPEDGTILAPTYPTVLPPRFASSSLLVDTDWSPQLDEMTLDIGNDVQLREDSGDISGYHSAVIVDREVGGTMSPEATSVADHDAYGDWLRQTQVTMGLIIGRGSTDGNTITIAAPKFQITAVDEGDRNGIQTDEIEYKLLRSASAGDDEFTMVFS